MSEIIELETLSRKYESAKKNMYYLFEALESARKEKEKALAKMNYNHQYMNKYANYYFTVWGEFWRLKNNNRSRIDSLNHKAQFASPAEVEMINAEIAELNREIQDAKKEAKQRASNNSRNKYYRSVYAFRKATRHYFEIEQEYERVKELCNQYQTDYEQAKKYHETVNPPSN